MTAAKIREALGVAIRYSGWRDADFAWPSEDEEVRAHFTLRALLDSGFIDAAMEYAKAVLRDARNDPTHGSTIDVARHKFYEAYRRLTETRANGDKSK